MPRRTFEVGMSTTGRSMRTALRMRVSMSAIGSVIMAGSILSTAAGNTPGDVPHTRGPGLSARRESARGPIGPAALLPARFLHSRDQSPQRQVPEADPADAEFAVVTTRAATQVAAVAVLDRELPRRHRLDH